MNNNLKMSPSQIFKVWKKLDSFLPIITMMTIMN